MFQLDYIVFKISMLFLKNRSRISKAERNILVSSSYSYITYHIVTSGTKYITMGCVRRQSLILDFLAEKVFLFILRLINDPV